MKRVYPGLTRALVLSVLAASAERAVAEPTLPAGDKRQFIARFVDAENAAFEQPDVANGPWSKLTPRKVILLPQNITTPSKLQISVEEVDVRVVHNGTWIGIAVSWQDDALDQSTASKVFCDAVAVGFPKGGLTETSPFMGGHGTGMEINHWKALWQRDIDQGYQEVTDLYPNTVADEYVGYRSEHLPDSNPASSAGMAEVMATPEGREGLPAVAIGNPMSQIHRETPVEQAIAEGFGTLSTQKQQDARARGAYENGRWTVVITRPLDTGDSADALLAVGEKTGINFAVWDGDEGDVSGRKSYSMFTPLLIAAKE